MAGLIVGVGIGVVFLRMGFTLGRARKQAKMAGLMLPLFAVLLLVLVLTQGTDGILRVSEKGPGAAAAPLLIALGLGLLIGALAQRSRFCSVGAFRDVILVRDFHLLWGIVALVVTAFIVNVSIGQFGAGEDGRVGFALMPVSHSAHVWNFLGMVLAGLAFCLAGGCPGRQIFLSGEGDTDAGVFVLGMLVGAGLAHNWALAAGPDKLVEGAFTLGGPGTNGMIAVIVGIVFCVVLGFTARAQE